MPIQTIDILYMCLSVSVIVITILLSIVLVRLMALLSDVNQTSKKIKEIAEKVDTFVTTPLLLSRRVIEFLSPFMDRAEEHFSSRKKKRS